MKKSLTAISLFSSSGIGDIALRKSGIKTIVANELLEDRCDLFKTNYPKTRMIQGPIDEKKSEIILETKCILKGKKLDFALVTPPCQGMSKNGRGKLLAEINAGKRPKVDPRNLLILPALEIINELEPTTVIFENVSEMINTSIPFNGNVLPIVEIIKTQLKRYEVETKVIEFADYGIPQRRLRLITIATKSEKLRRHILNFGSLMPLATHSKNGKGNLKKWVSVREIIGTMESLDGRNKLVSSVDHLHRISKLDELKYWWVKSTPANRSAFDNQCVECDFTGNKTHFSKKNSLGINRSSLNTPIFCVKCDSLLPRPSVSKNGSRRLMRGFTSAYKRMDWDLPASAITRNFPYVCSDNKIHPEQHRSLSLREACMIHTIGQDDFDFSTESGIEAKLTTIRDTLGESIPPLILKIVIENLLKICSGDHDANYELIQKQLIFA